jgi:hypothetical protein
MLLANCSLYSKLHYVTRWQNAYQGQMSCVLPGVLKTSMTAWIPATTLLLFGIEQEILSLRAYTFVTSKTLLLSSNTCKQ